MRHELFDVIESDEIRQCPNCKAKVSGRPNKIYCSSNCRKRGTETKRNSQLSPTKRRENLEFFDRALRLAEELYKTPPPQRLEFMRDLIDYARTGEDRVLRNILCNPMLLRPNPYTQRFLFYRRSRVYCTISQAASNYCKRFWRANIKDVVFCKVPQPDTGEC